MRIEFDPRVNASNILRVSPRTRSPAAPTQYSSQLISQFVGSLGSSKSPCDLPGSTAMVLGALRVAIVVVDRNGHASAHRLRLIIATTSRRRQRYQPLLPTEVSLAHECLTGVAVRVKIPAWSGSVVRQLIAAIASGLQISRLARVVSWVSKAHACAVGRAIVVDVQTSGLAVVCCTDVELAWLFRRGDYRPDKAAISAWRGV